MLTSNKSKLIDRVRTLHCGWCEADMKTLIRDDISGKRKFPATVVLLHHRDKGYFLFDTGYSTAINNGNLRTFIYNRVCPAYISTTEVIDVRLNELGINSGDISTVILSHLHPDHIGGCKYLPSGRFVVSQELYNDYQHGKCGLLLFKTMLPVDFDQRLIAVTCNSIGMEESDNNWYDLFTDGSVLLTVFNGHAHGQLGMYLPEHGLLFAADVCWGLDLLNKVTELRLVPRRLQDDFIAYQKSIARVNKFAVKGVKIILSHDNNPEKEWV